MRFSLAWLLLVISTAAGAQPPAAISGKVVDARSGQPLVRCVVVIRPTTQRTAPLSVTTGDDGRFAFAGLAVGKYQLSGSLRGYLTQAYQAHGDFSTAIAVGPGLVSQDLVFQLTPQSIVYGLVTDEAGEAIRRAQVKLYADREQGGVRSTITTETAMTDDQGRYEIAEIAPGDYYLSVSAKPWYAHDLGVTGYFRAEGIRDQEDSPLHVAYATTFYPNATNSDEAAPFPLRGGERLEMNLTLQPQHALRLRVPVPQADHVSFNVDLSHSVFGQPEPLPTGMQSQHDGVLEIDGLLPGRYEVTLNQFGEGPNIPAKHFTADVGGGANTVGEPELVEEVVVTGKVSGLEENTLKIGITLFSPHPRRNYFAPLAKSGEFSVKVPPGKYEVIGQIPGWYLARVTSPNAPVLGRMLEVKGGASPRLELTAGKGFGQIDGFVTEGSQRPGGVLVLLAPEDSKDNQILFRRDQSDSDGSFTLYNVIPGRYRLMAIDQGWDLEWSDANVLRAFAKKSVAIEMHEGEKMKQRVEVQPK